MRRVKKSIFGEAFAVLSAAMSASAAVRNHRRPADSTLVTLGIDPAQFPSVREF